MNLRTEKLNLILEALKTEKKLSPSNDNPPEHVIKARKIFDKYVKKASKYISLPPEQSGDTLIIDRGSGFKLEFEKAKFFGGNPAAFLGNLMDELAKEGIKLVGPGKDGSYLVTKK